MKYYLALIIFVFLFSCDEKQNQNSKKEVVKPLLSVVKEYSKVKGINPVFKKNVENWSELKAVESFLERFKKVSANEVLSNALELKGLVENLRDSVKPNLFDTSSFKARVNIFYNETLRLADMTTIPAIKAEEVHIQTEKIIDAFSSINAKVNTVFSKKRFEDEIDVDVTFIGLDSTKMDSVTKKSVHKKLKIEPSKFDKVNMPKKPKYDGGLNTRQ